MSHLQIGIVLYPEAEELVRKLENRKLLAQINDAYADGPGPEERDHQRRLWEMQRRQLRKEDW